MRPLKAIFDPSKSDHPSRVLGHESIYNACHEASRVLDQVEKDANDISINVHDSESLEDKAFFYSLRKICEKAYQQRTILKHLPRTPSRDA